MGKPFVNRRDFSWCANAHEFSTHAAIPTNGHQRQALERPCHDILSAATANDRLSGNSADQVVLQFKSAYRDGSVMFY